MGLLKASFAVVLLAVGIYFIKQYMNGGVCMSQDRLDGKVVIVTGANTGIGKETVKELAHRGAKVYLACRSVQRAESAVADVKQSTGLDGSQLPILQLDLASLKSVRSFVSEFKKRENHLDILINNAGVMWVDQGKTEDGFETTLGINHLGPFLLTHLLMDLLTTGSSPSRIINVSAKLYEHGTINFNDLMLEENYDGLAAYYHSKLANILFTRELARRLEGKGVTAYALHPGVIATELQRNWLMSRNVVLKYVLSVLSWPFRKDIWHGAQTTVCCAVDKNLANESGKYYSDCQEVQLAANALDEKTARRLWDVSVSLVKLDPSEINPLVR